jgi:hypothetical protein
LKDDTLAIADLLADGVKPNDIRDVLEISEKDYNTAIKQIYRARKKVRPQGGYN